MAKGLGRKTQPTSSGQALGPMARIALSALVGMLLWLGPAQASADPGSGCDRAAQVGQYYCFYPYYSTYTAVDEGYSFAADPVQGRVLRPKPNPVPEPGRPKVLRLMRPRVSFDDALSAGAQSL